MYCLPVLLAATEWATVDLRTDLDDLSDQSEVIGEAKQAHDFTQLTTTVGHIACTPLFVQCLQTSISPSRGVSYVQVVRTDTQAGSVLCIWIYYPVHWTYYPVRALSTFWENCMSSVHTLQAFCSYNSTALECMAPNPATKAQVLYLLTHKLQVVAGL